MSNFVGYGYKAAKTPFGKKVIEKVTKFFKPKGKVSPDITSVAPNVPKTKAEKVKSRLNILKQRTKGSQAKLDQNLFEIEQASKKRKEFKRGTGLKRPSDVEKIKKAFGPKQKPQTRMTGKKKKFPDLTGDGKVTFADILKGRGVINGKKKKKVI